LKKAKEYIKVNANGKESVLIAVIKQRANLITMSTDMDAKLKELQKIIPQDIKITYYEQSSFVGDAVKA
jgi:multidrug efflux pump subunit AcrB